MEFINGKRGIKVVAFVAVGHPVLIVPGIIQAPDDRSAARKDLAIEREGVALIVTVAVLVGLDKKFIKGAFAHTGNEAFPNAGTIPTPRPTGANAYSIR